jgi:hypothetical protein
LSHPTPELSVVIATHDNLAVLRQALESWRRFAAAEPVELLVVEDGCTDGTREYLDAWLQPGGTDHRSASSTKTTPTSWSAPTAGSARRAPRWC